MARVSRRSFLSVPAAVAFGALGRQITTRPADRFDHGNAHFAATETPGYDPSFAITTEELSIGPGEELIVRGRAPGPVSISVHRIGWTDDGSLPVPVAEGRADLRSAGRSGSIDHWAVALRTPVTEAWRSGLYVAIARSDDGRHRRFAPFVVRAARPSAPIVVHVPFTTYHAYNAWGGASLYAFNSPIGPTSVLDRRRPFDGFDGAGFLFYGDWQLARWLDRERYEVEYITSYDLHESGAHLSQAALFVSAFHDEYWSTPMRTHLEGHLSRGGNAAFFAANSIYWRIRLDEATMTCHKATSYEDDRHADITATWRSDLVGRPEHLLLGSHYGSYEFPYGGGYDWTVTDARHWCYESTGLRRGDRIPGIIGYEWDLCPDPDADGVEVVASTPFVDRTGTSRRHDATLRTHPGGGTAVNVGTTYWARMLTGDRLFRADAAVGQITHNVLRRLGGPS